MYAGGWKTSLQYFFQYTWMIFGAKFGVSLFFRPTVAIPGLRSDPGRPAIFDAKSSPTVWPRSGESMLWSDGPTGTGLLGSVRKNLPSVSQFPRFSNC